MTLLLNSFTQLIQLFLQSMKRVILIILDGSGIGDAPDAEKYGDSGANTLGNLSLAVDGLNLPNLQKMGLGNLTHIKGVPSNPQPSATIFRGIEVSAGKDTTTGHFEIAGITVTKPFATFPNGFSGDIINRFCEENDLPGVLGNKTASGTEIIKELGETHIRTKKPIVYTSADSVFQIACHEDEFGLERLYEICKSARIICDELHIARVIARPFITENGQFKRTYNRKDYSIEPPEKTVMQKLQSEGVKIVGLGKIPSIYNYKGFDEQIHTSGNDDGMTRLGQAMEKWENAFYYINLIDFDMLYGHRRDSAGYAQALEKFDSQLSELINKLDESDLLIMMADHGNDPTFKGTDHTREMVPVLLYLPNRPGGDLGTIKGFYNVAATIYSFFTNKNFKIGKNIFEK